MTTGFGAEPLKDGNGVVTVGTTSDDIQRVTGSLYSAGLISGGGVTTSPSALTYTVGSGVAAFPIVSDLSTPYKPQNQKTVLGPIPATTLTVTAPSSGTRTDIVYAQQLTPLDDNDATIVVNFGPTLPARAVQLAKFTVTAGNTSSNQFAKVADVKYSIPYGASLGRLVNYTSLFNSPFTVAPSGTQPRSTVGSGTFYLPTDRLIRVSLTATVSANLAVGFDNSKYCEAGYEVLLDNNIMFTWTTGGLHQAWQEYYWSGDIALAANPTTARTIKVNHFRAQGPGTPRGRGINAAQPYARILVEDIGPMP
ncbi:minor tail protein [Arthrobacter phage Racecar]|nr:minor tail protein [Arthrobacter phage Racecar]QFG12848.1 minor tail protein [Arthrobacter phage Mimi]